MATFTIEPITEDADTQGPTRQKFTIEPIDDAPEPQPGRDSVASLSNTLAQIPAGAVEAVKEVGQSIGSMADFLRDNIPGLKALDPGDQFSVPLPEFEPPKGTAAGVVKGISQFLAVFVPFSRVAKGLGVTGSVKRGLTAGAAADITAIDPDDPKLADLVHDLDPSLQNPLIDFLRSDPTDSEAEKRFKRALEGAGVGVAAEGLFRAGKELLRLKSVKAQAKPKPTPKPTAVETEATIVGEGPPRSPSSTKPVITPDDAISLKQATDEGLEKMAGSINLERLDTDLQVKHAINQAADAIPKRAPITHEQVSQAANELGFTVENVEAFSRSTAKDRAKFLGARNVMVTVAKRYDDARVKFAEDQSVENLQALKRAEEFHLRAFKATQEVAGDAGRALQSFRIMAAGADIPSIAEKEINKLLLKLREKGPISDEITKRLASLDKHNPAELHAMLSHLHAQTASTADKLFEAYLSSILSGPQTQVANIIGNTATLALRPFERIATAGADLLLRPIKPRDRFFGEALIDVLGMSAGITQGFKAAARTYKTGMVTFGSKLEDVAGKLPSIAGTKGEIIRTPLKLLSAADEFFKATSRSGDMYAQAYRLGVKQGFKNKDLVEFMTSTVANPSLAMVKNATTESAYRTFTKELGQAGKALNFFRQNVPGLRYMLPFLTTPINIAKFGLERTPLKALDLIRMASKGQLLKNGELPEEVGKLAIGAGLMWWVSQQVIAGHMTGTGPADREDFNALRATGWQPLSLRVGDTYISYSRIEPFATAFGIMADSTEILQAGVDAGIVSDEQQSDVIDKMSQMVVENLTDKTFFQGLGDITDVMSDPGRYGRRFLQNRVGPIIPNLIGQAARAQDDILRDTGRPDPGSGLIEAGIQTALNGIRSRLPKVGDFSGRQGLFPIRDNFGDAIEQPGNFWYRYLSPVRISERQGTAAEEVIAEVGAGAQKLPRTITVKNKTIRLNDKQYDQYQVIVGEKVKQLVGVIAPRLGSMTKEQKQETIKQQFSKARSIGRLEFIAQLK